MIEVKVLYIEEDSIINRHLGLAEELGISNTKTSSVEDQDDLRRLVDNEKPDLLIIDSRFQGLKDSKTMRYLSKLGETVVILTNRINGCSSMTEISCMKDALQEKPLSENGLLERVRFLRLKETVIEAG